MRGRIWSMQTESNFLALFASSSQLKHWSNDIIFKWIDPWVYVSTRGMLLDLSKISFISIFSLYLIYFEYLQKNTYSALMNVAIKVIKKDKKIKKFTNKKLLTLFSIYRLLTSLPSNMSLNVSSILTKALPFDNNNDALFSPFFIVYNCSQYSLKALFCL